ncbi:hypothetical protein GOODEAATRI_033428, partial [Goodea atripinnis]
RMGSSHIKDILLIDVMDTSTSPEQTGQKKVQLKMHPNTCIRMLSVAFSSAFNPVISHRLVNKPNLRLPSTLGVMDFLTSTGRRSNI